MMPAAAFLLVLAAAVWLGKMAVRPIQLCWKFLCYSGTGLLLLLIFNGLSSWLGWIDLPVRGSTVFLAGFLGIPGLIVLLVFRLLLE